MFGVVFDGHPNPLPLLFPDGFEGHPLRKEFVLAARVAKPWPGAKEPGESCEGAPSRRRMLPPGVPQDWGPAARQAAQERQARRPARGISPEGGEDGGDVRPARHRDQTAAGRRRVHRAAVAGRAGRAQGDGPHAGQARPDVRRGLPRLGAARRGRCEVRPEGGRCPSGGRSADLHAGAGRGADPVPRCAGGHPGRTGRPGGSRWTPACSSRWP